MIAACGLAPEVGGWSLAVIGLFNIVGSLGMGWAVGRWRMKSLLSLLYTVRGLAVLIFLFAPKTPAVVLILPPSWASRSCPRCPHGRAGRQDVWHGQHGHVVRHRDAVAPGGRLPGAYLGGSVFQATGSCDWVWYMDIVLALGAALVNLPIREVHLATACRRGRVTQNSLPRKPSIDSADPGNTTSTTSPRLPGRPDHSTSISGEHAVDGRRSPACRGSTRKPFTWTTLRPRFPLFGGLAAGGWL